MELALSEIGPRFVLKLVRIHAGSFAGPILYENPNFSNPALVCMNVVCSAVHSCFLGRIHYEILAVYFFSH
jgi:hypothetical protein